MDETNKIIQLYFESIREFNEFEKNPRDFGTGDFLYSSEIHTIQMIGYNENINLSTLAEKLNISKSGTSKSVKKLLDKELITKNRRLDNNKEVVFNLTRKGSIAFTGHEEFSKTMFEAILNILSDLDDKQKEFMESFLRDIVKEVKKLNKL